MKNNNYQPPDPRHNLLLAALTDAAWMRWLPHLEPVDLVVGQVLCKSGNAPAHVYFPTTAGVAAVFDARR